MTSNSPKQISDCEREVSLELFELPETFENQYDCRRFVEAALKVPDKEIIIETFYENGRLNPPIEFLLNCNYTLDPGTHCHSYSFERIAVPFCALLADPQIQSSQPRAIVKELYRSVLDTETYPFIDNCSENVRLLLNEDASPIDGDYPSGTATNEYTPNTLSNIVEPIAHLLLACVTMHSAVASKNDSVNDLFDALCKASNVLKSAHSSCSDLLLQSLLQEMRPILEHGRCMILAHMTSEFFEKDTQASHTSQDPPGQLSKMGPRHNFDFDTYTQISVHLATEELLSENPPYLPKLSQPYSPWIENPWERHLDAMYRLLRHDMTNIVKKAFNQYIRIVEFIEGNAFEIVGDNSVDGLCYVWKNVKVSSITTDVFGANFQLEIPQIAEGERAERQNFWEDGMGSNLLQQNSLIVLMEQDAEKITSSTVHIAKIMDERREMLALSPLACYVGAIPVNDSDILKMISLVDKGIFASRTQAPSLTMLQIVGHFSFGTEVVLCAMKELNKSSLAIQNAITPNDRVDGPKSNKPTGLNISQKIGAPQYVSKHSKYDLSFLATTEEAREALQEVQVYSASKLLKYLMKLKNFIYLDKSQIKAFVYGISKKISLIQGPPGCGKTFIGVQIVKAILKNSEGWFATERFGPFLKNSRIVSQETNPVLCVCFTNHALDQFLESLIESKAVTAEKVIRIGKRSSSSVLKDREIGKIYSKARQIYTATGRDQFHMKLALQEWSSAMRICKILDFEIDELVLALKGQSGGEMFADWVEQSEPDVYSEIVQHFSDTFSEHSPYEKMFFNDAIESWIHAAKSVDIGEYRVSKFEKAKQGYIEQVQHKLANLLENVKRRKEELLMAKHRCYLQILKSASVVGCTTSGAAMNSRLLSLFGPRVIVCEEAAEASESHLLATLSPSTQHLIMIGDHEQLRPKTSEYDLTVESGKGYDLDISLFERLVREKNVPIARLSTQRRMHPRIADLARIYLYPFLKDSQVVKKYETSPTGFDNPVFFLTHNHFENDSSEAVGRNCSYYNTYEVEQIAALAKYVLKQGFAFEQVAVLTPYLGQLKRIRERFATENVSVLVSERNTEDLILANLSIDTPTDNHETLGCVDNSSHERESTDVTSFSGVVKGEMNNCLRLSTVDNFQGEEADIVLISTVRSNLEGNLGFMKSSNRANVMLTRARLGMYIIGNAETMLSAQEDTLLHQVVQNLQEDDLVGEQIILRCARHGNSTVASGQVGFPEDGGCNQICKERLTCGHECLRLCHPDDMDHSFYKCSERCLKILKCEHQCPLLCHEPCGGCEVPVMVLLRCGHEESMACEEATATDEVKCSLIIKEGHKAPCGHIVSLQCWEGTTPKRSCRQPCGKKKQCGHKCREQCSGRESARCVHNYIQRDRQLKYVAADTVPGCDEMCGQILKCGHVCADKCHGRVDCKPCGEVCRHRCPHKVCTQACKEVCQKCGEACEWECSVGCANRFKCEKTCVEPCTRLPCNRGCNEKLACGHSCPGVCGEKCPADFCTECVKPSENSMSLPVVYCKVSESIWEAKLAMVLGKGIKVIILEECGHAFLVDDLDEHVHFGEWYESEYGNRQANPMWKFVHNGRLKFPDTLNRCPVCQGSLLSVRRYGRLQKLLHLQAQVEKWIREVHFRLQHLAEVIHETEKRVKTVARFYAKLMRTFTENERLNDEREIKARVSSACGRAAYVCKMARSWKTSPLLNSSNDRATTDKNMDEEGVVRVMTEYTRDIVQGADELEVESLFLRANMTVSIIAINVTRKDVDISDMASRILKMLESVGDLINRVRAMCKMIANEQVVCDKKIDDRDERRGMSERAGQTRVKTLRSIFMKQKQCLLEHLGFIRNRIRSRKVNSVIQKLQESLDSYQ